jgi:hypothetical protein
MMKRLFALLVVTASIGMVCEAGQQKKIVGDATCQLDDGGFLCYTYADSLNEAMQEVLDEINSQTDEGCAPANNAQFVNLPNFNQYDPFNEDKWQGEGFYRCGNGGLKQ